MKNRIFILLVFAVTGIVSLASDCGKKPADPPRLEGGKGGNASLTVYPKHHNRPISGCRVYLKYAANEFSPDTAHYNEIITAPAGQDSVAFTQLKAGSYYLYGYGYDPSISMPVFGGIPYQVSTEKHYSITLPVTEGD